MARRTNRSGLSWRGLVGIAIVATLAVAPGRGVDSVGATEAASSRRADVPPPGRVVTRYEDRTGHTIKRDAGISVPIAPMPDQPAGENRSLWIFGDTSEWNGDQFLGFRYGTFGAIGPYAPGQVPTDLSHVPTPPAHLTVPNEDPDAHLVPNPTEMRLPNGSPCNTGPALYQAAWPFGATRGPQGPMTLYDGATPVSVPDGSQLVFISMTDVCVYEEAAAPSSCADGEVWDLYGPIRWSFQRTKLVAYRPADNRIVATTTLFQTSDGSCLPWQRQLFYQPIFSGGYLYRYASNCEFYGTDYGTCVRGTVTAARVPVAQLHDPAAYRWADGAGGWTANYQDAGTVLPATPDHFGPIMVDVHDFSSAGEGFLLLEQSSFGGHYNLYQAPSPAGPWTLRRSGVMPGCVSSTDEHCYNLYGHPELSTPDHLAYSYYNAQEAVVTVVDIGGV